MLRLTMPKKPKNTTDRPEIQDLAVDVMGEILNAVHLQTAIWGELQLGAPWRLKIPPRDYLSFYVVARGSLWLELHREKGSHAREPKTLALSTGDAVLLPLGSAHEIRDAEKSDAPAMA